MPSATRKWEIFPGRNKFCFHGRVIRGPDVTVLCINVSLIVGTTLMFVIFDCPDLTVQVSPFIPIATVILFIFVMSSLLKTSFSDPGIIPRATPDEAIYIEKQIKIAACGDAPADRPPPRTKEVLIRGQCVKLKYCFTCKIFRPPRASHCSLCDNCVDHFDHHCPWVGNCVGRRNYRYFYLFTVSLSLYIAFVFICTCTHLYLLSAHRSMAEAVAESPASVIVILITFFSCWSVFGLAAFHSYLAASNQTTNEDIKGSFSNKRGGSSRNPYSSGNGCSNCCYILCGPFKPSLIDSEGFITPEPPDKKIVAVRQNSRLGNATSLYSSSSSYPMNGVRSFPSVNQSTSQLQSVISGSSSQISSRPPQSMDSCSVTTSRDTNTINLNNNQMPRNKHVFHENHYESCSELTSKHNSIMMDVSKLALDLDEVEAPSKTVFDYKDTICLEPLSASKLQLLQDTTMIESALDLDSLSVEETSSSLGAKNHAVLSKNKRTL